MVRGGSPLGSGAGASADQLAVRRHNLSLVLTHLRAVGPRSRAKVAAETGLNKATVSSLVAELVGRGLVAEGETERGAVGRPSQQIDLDGTNFFTIGTEINVDYLAALAMNVRGEVVAEQQVPLDAAGLGVQAVLRRLSRLVTALIDPLTARGGRLVGLTVAVPGLTERATGTLLRAPNLGWADTAVVADLRRLLDDPPYPILLDNEANLAARAEMEVGGRSAISNLILLTGGAGVGGGIVADGQLIRGSQGLAGEVGHMQLDPGGATCGCGRRGCWETVVGLNALLVAAADEDDPIRDPSLDLVQRLDALKGRAEAGDPRTLDALTRTGSWLCSGAGILINLFNPEVLVLGGHFAVLGPWLAPPLAECLPDRVFAPAAGSCRVELSTLGFSAAVRGGALEALARLFEQPTLVGDLTATPSGAMA
jgi:predicted NBD/HSP70 family sugar kinase